MTMGAVETKKLSFVSIGLGIMHGKKWVAKATSVTMARRIANALNSYTPNDKGV